MPCVFKLNLNYPGSSITSDVLWFLVGKLFVLVDAFIDAAISQKRIQPSKVLYDKKRD